MPQAGQPTVPQPPSAPLVPASQVPGAPPAGEQWGSFRDALASRGINPAAFGEASDDDILDALYAQVRAANDPQTQQMLQLGREAAQNYQAWQAFRAQQGQQQVAPQAPAAIQPAEEKWWPDGPAWDPEMEKYLELDANGEVVVKQPYITRVAPDLPQQYVARKKWERSRQETLLHDPLAAIMPGLEPKLKETYATKEYIDQKLKEYADQQYLAALAEQKKPQIYEVDQFGRTVVNPLTNQPKMTEHGQRYLEAMNVIQRFDPQNPGHVAQMAELLAAAASNGSNGQVAQHQVPSPAPVPVQAAVPPPQPQPPQPQPTSQELFVQRQAQFAGVSDAQRGGAFGQPGMAHPQDLAPPSFSNIFAQLTGTTR
jgi:hypothetical protein